MSKEVTNFLLDFQSRVVNSTIEDRRDLFEHLSEIIKNYGIDGTNVRTICKILPMTITRYKDSQSQQLVRNVIMDLLRVQHDIAVENIMAIFRVLAVKELPNAPIGKAAKPALITLGWSVLLNKHCDITSETFKNEMPKLIEYQSVLYNIVLQSENERLMQLAQVVMFEIFGDSFFCSLYESKLLQLGTSAHALLTLLMLLRFKNQNTGALISLTLKELLLDMFVKGIIMTRHKHKQSTILACSFLLSSITMEDFETKIYTPLQRALLRNPEAVVHLLGLLIPMLTFDLSKYSVSFAQLLLPNTYSKNDDTKNDSLATFKLLASKCSSMDAVSAILMNIFNVLNGSEGKVAVAEYRINLYKCAGYLTDNAVPAEKIAEISEQVIEMFSKMLLVEVHEKVICQCLIVFGFWTSKFAQNINNNSLSQIFTTGLELKTVTNAVRLSYLQWLLVSVNLHSLHTQECLINILLKIFDKGAQNTLHLPTLSEAACAACILFEVKGTNNDARFLTFWSAVFDLNKSFIFSERFTTAASPEAMCCVVRIALKVLTEHLNNVKGNSKILFKVAVMGILSTSALVRNSTNALLPFLRNCTDRTSIVENFLMEMIWKLDLCEKNVTAGDIENVSKSISKAICLICTVLDSNNSNKTSVLMQLFMLCQHPLVKYSEPRLWEIIMKEQFNLDSEDFISQNYTKFEYLAIESFKLNQTYENAVESLVLTNCKSFLRALLAKATAVLLDPVIISVTKDEYFTYLTPEGELYDKSVIPNLEDSYSTAGVRRENKAYSYKEQIEELQLRREIEEKRRKEGKAKPLQLNSKQQEIIKNQTEKEKAIKQRLKVIDQQVNIAIKMIDIGFNINSKHSSTYMSEVLDSILIAMRSPLAAEALVQLYFRLTKICFEKELSTSAVIATIRLQSPACDLSNEYTERNIVELVKDAMHEIFTFSVYKSNYLTCASFSFAYNFIERALAMEQVSKNEDLVLKGIQIMQHNIGDQGKAILYDVNPNFLKFSPTLKLFKFLMSMIQSQNGRVQNQAVAAMLDVAKNKAINCCLVEDCVLDELNLFLRALENGLSTVREIALRVLLIFSDSLKSQSANNAMLSAQIKSSVWIAKFDNIQENRFIANKLWDNIGLQEPDPSLILNYVTHYEKCIQEAAAESLISLLSKNPDNVTYLLNELLKIYSEKLILIPAKLDLFNREITPPIDQWRQRRGLAIALSRISIFFSVQDVNLIMQFMVSSGLGDRVESVQKEMLASSLTIVDIHGKNTIITLLPVFEDFLDKAPKSESYDSIRQAVVILMGSLARHLEKYDKRIEPIVKRLLNALSTPSQQVQEAVANCLPHLIPSVTEEAHSIIKRLMQQLIKSDKYGERRGAAYGIAGVVKGLGILSLKQFDIMTKLTGFIQEKKSYKSREGALFAFEILCTTLGRLFEPYIVHVLPYLLQCFGDSCQYVRQAADDTAKVVMAKLSAHGVKLVLPSLLEALDEDSWRTKTASVELLGAMAYCAPKQLSSCLPSIVPKLIEVLGDSHTKVQEAGGDALKVIGSVIKNPEIQALVPVLLKALEDPSKNTHECLCNLLQTQFVHFIDAPSLALIMPVVQRAFIDRSTETRKMSAQIIGNMYSLTDQKDLAPYLPKIIPGLKMSLLDPVPEVRAVSARALGAMVRGMGESSFEDLLPWLMQTLTSETSSVDRSGAAQGLSEVVAGLGVEKLHKLMPEIIATADRNDIAPHVKDGYIMMFIFMPATFPQDFTPYIGQIINPILKALADENEYVRDTALKAGQRIVSLYADTAVTLLLPELEKGLFDDNWRIRFSSVQLLGDLLYRISGVSGKMTTETASEDDNFGTEQSHTAIISFLGNDRRNRVLSGLYMGRSDVSLMVRQSALHVWKVVVTNTPRTLKEILPTLFGLLLGCLASTSYDKRQVAARTLGDLVRKLGERVLPEIIPILEKGLRSDQADQRQGVCIGLSEIMASTSKEMVLSFADSLVPTVRTALCDPLPEVRVAAAKTFDSLHSTIGYKALDDILPCMLQGLTNCNSSVVDNTLDGLRQVMSIKSRVVLPYLVPHLTTPPVNTKALSILVSVAGESLTKFLPKILHASLQSLSDAQGHINELQELEYCQMVVLSVNDEVGIRIVMDTLMSSANSESLSTRKSSASLLAAFCIHSKGDYRQYIAQLLRCLLRLFAENDKEILQRAWEALNAVVKGLDSASQISHVSDVRQAVRFAASDTDHHHLPGFCLPKGIAPLLPIFREAILNGLPEEKENAAQGLGEIIVLTSAESLQPSVVHITGPLIRILGDRFNAGVKASVIETLAILLNKVGVMLKQFLPQLQTTFLKSLNDSNRIVRIKAGYALSALIVIHSRADPMFNEIHNNLRTTDDSSIRETMLQALRNVITPAGNKMSDVLRKQVFFTLLGLLGHQEDNSRCAAGGCLGALFKYLPEEEINDIIKNDMLGDDNDDSLTFHGRTVFLFVALKYSAMTILNSKHEQLVQTSVIAHISSEKVSISSNGIRAATYIIEHWLNAEKSVKKPVTFAFTRAMNHSSNEIKQLVAKSCNYIARTVIPSKLSLELLKCVIPMLVNGSKEKHCYVKSNSEIALISILHLRENDVFYNDVCQNLDVGARESLSEVVSRVLRKTVVQPAEKDEDLDDTNIA